MDKKDSKNLERIASALEGIEKSLKKQSFLQVSSPTINISENIKKELDEQFNKLGKLYREG
jgi:hypothetical protein